jgi:hypothetical protein
MRDPIRDRIGGGTLDPDRLWKIHGPDWRGAVTDYNNEITGATAELANLPECRYGNYIWPLLDACRRLGYRIEQVDERSPDYAI